MTAIEKAHFFLEIGKTLEEILAALDELEKAIEIGYKTPKTFSSRITISGRSLSQSKTS